MTTETLRPLDTSGIDRAVLLDWMRTMLLIREFDDRADALSIKGKIPGGIHSSVGQEAVAVGVMSALAPHDVVATTHRSHHHAIARGLDPRSIMAELYGKADGCMGGRGGSMHLAEARRGYLGGNGIVGAAVGIAAGAALAAKMRGTKQIAVGFMGDGGLNTGRTWEAVNLAVIWKLPLVVVCENNQFGVQTRVDHVTGGGSVVRRAQGFGVRAETVDGQDVAAVHRVVAAAAGRARGEQEPMFVEALTYRYMPHNTGEVVTYRTDDEVKLWRDTMDPVARLRAALSLSDAEYDALARAATQSVDEAEAFAELAPLPPVADATRGVYA